MDKGSMIVIAVLVIAVLFFVFMTLNNGVSATSGSATANFISGGCGR